MINTFQKDLSRGINIENKLLEIVKDEDVVNPPEVAAQLQRLEMVDD